MSAGRLPRVLAGMVPSSPVVGNRLGPASGGRQPPDLSAKTARTPSRGSGACEANLNLLGTVVFDLGRFGIQFVASPRHADGLVVTGLVSENTRSALLETYAALSSAVVDFLRIAFA